MPDAPPTTELPVEACVPALRHALADSGHAVLHAPPGAGKTTLVPLRLLDEPWLDGRRIVVLEPRRVATRAAARRMALLLGEEVGATVGYRTRDERRVSRTARIEVVTEGILTRRLQDDASLPGVGLVVLDEVHERSVQSDLAMALALDARSVLRPDLRLLAMSATPDTERLASLLGGDDETAPVVASEGRAHPVEIRWLPPGPRDRPDEHVARASLDALRAHDGDVLVFLAGAAEIRRVVDRLRRAVPADVDVRPLFGALSATEQDAALAPSPAGRRRVVVATDLAETSLTVEGVRVVVDAGRVRTPSFDPATGMTRLQTGPTSRASADQRAGRAGREAPGVAYRLWAQGDHAHRRTFAAPEIATVDLAGLALEVARWGTPVEDLALLDAPPTSTWAEAQALLTTLGAIDDAGRITPRGRAMSELPVHPRLAAAVISALDEGDAVTACALAALLEEGDVLGGHPDRRPADVAERLRLLADPDASHPLADRRSLRTVRRRAEELARRVGAPRGQVEPTGAGGLLARAYPDRLAQATGGGRFRLRQGTGAHLPDADALVGEALLVVADLDAGGRRAAPGRSAADAVIRLAASIDEADVAAVAGDAVERVESLAWDPDRDDLRHRVERRLGALVLSSREGRAEPGEATAAALVAHVRDAGLATLRWSDGARALQARLGFARSAFGNGSGSGPGAEWPDVSDEALLATLEEWLAPRLLRATGRTDLERLDTTRILRELVGAHRIPELDRLVPSALTLAGGRSATIDYRGEQPSIAVRAQDLYGTTTHPTIAAGRIPLVVELLSPAGRPIQVTADLPGFWAGSWSEVRKDMAGRYPKHDWPEDPATARPGRRPNRRRR